MKKELIVAYVAASLIGSATLATGAGFKINEQGSKAMGMANAFVAQADDPTALYYNPAGIAFLKGAQFNLGGLVIAVPQTSFDGTTALSGSEQVSERAKRDLFIAPSLYATYSFENMPVTVGLGVNSIYPLAKSWDDSSAFRNQIQNIAIKPINFQPTIAYRFDDYNLGIAVGLDVTHTIVSLQKVAYDPVGGELGNLGLDGTATDFGYNMGLKWKPLKQLSFGVAYRSEITLHIDGDVNYLPTQALGAAIVGQGASFPPGKRVTSKASTTITLPDSLAFGVAWQPVEKLTLEFDAERTGWGALQKLQFTFDNTALNSFNNKPDPKNWKDAWCYKLGVQYAATKNLDLRAGYAYDTNPIPDSTLGPMLPDSDRHNVTLGMGLHNDYASIDMAYMWVHWIDRTVNNQSSATLLGENGTFKSDAHLFGASFTIKF